jgi:hypothetical protein
MVEDRDARDVGMKNPSEVRIPSDVAFSCAKDLLRGFLELDVLRASAPQSIEQDVKDWCSRLLGALEGQSNEQPNTLARMQTFRDSVKHPPFFPTDPTLRFVGALSFFGGKAGIIKPAGDSSSPEGHLAVLDGLTLRHIGYQEFGRGPVFDAPADLERLLGCAVFVVGPAKQNNPTKK